MLTDPAAGPGSAVLLLVLLDGHLEHAVCHHLVEKIAINRDYSGPVLRSQDILAGAGAPA